MLFQNALLDLLGGAVDETTETFPSETIKQPVVGNQDLLDLLGNHRFLKWIVLI